MNTSDLTYWAMHFGLEVPTDLIELIDKRREIIEYEAPAVIEIDPLTVKDYGKAIQNAAIAEAAKDHIAELKRKSLDPLDRAIRQREHEFEQSFEDVLAVEVEQAGAEFTRAVSQLATRKLHDGRRVFQPAKHPQDVDIERELLSRATQAQNRLELVEKFVASSNFNLYVPVRLVAMATPKQAKLLTQCGYDKHPNGLRTRFVAVVWEGLRWQYRSFEEASRAQGTPLAQKPVEKRDEPKRLYS